MWCFVTPEKYYKENMKKYNNRIITYCDETKEFKMTGEVSPPFK